MGMYNVCINNSPMKLTLCVPLVLHAHNRCQDLRVKSLLSSCDTSLGATHLHHKLQKRTVELNKLWRGRKFAKISTFFEQNWSYGGICFHFATMRASYIWASNQENNGLKSFPRDKEIMIKCLASGHCCRC